MNEHIIEYHKYQCHVSETVSVNTEKLLLEYIRILEGKLFQKERSVELESKRLQRERSLDSAW